MLQMMNMITVTMIWMFYGGLVNMMIHRQKGAKEPSKSVAGDHRVHEGVVHHSRAYCHCFWHWYWWTHL